MIIIAVVMCIGCFFGDQRFMNMFVLWFVTTGNCSENHNIKGKYEGKNFHDLNAKIEDNWKLSLIFFN